MSKKFLLYLAGASFAWVGFMGLPHVLFSSSTGFDLLTGQTAFAQEAKQKAKKKARERKQEAGQERQDDRQDRRDTRQDRREERRDTVQDRTEERRDTRQDIREERRDTRQDIREERHDTYQDWREDRRVYNRGAVISYYNIHRVGHRVTILPVGYMSFILLGGTYYYYSGVYYQAYPGGGYVVINAPFGAHVAVLPFGYRHFYVGPTRYYYVNNTYYTYLPAEKVYEVVEKPEGIEDEELAAYSDSVNGAEYQELVMYPTEGQSEEQQAQDKYECHEWAVDESGYNPVTATDDDGYDTYLKATEACLEGRGYGAG